MSVVFFIFPYFSLFSFDVVSVGSLPMVQWCCFSLARFISFCGSSTNIGLLLQVVIGPDVKEC